MKREKFFLLIGSIVLALGGILLIGLQYRWINQIAYIEKERIRGEMRRNTIRALFSAGDEVRLLISLLQSPFHPNIKDGSAGTEELVENLRYWKEHAAFPELLEEVHMLKKRGTSFFAYGISETGISEIDPGGELLTLLRELETETPLPDIQKHLQESEKGEYILIPSKDRGTVFLYRINAAILLGKILPGYISDFLEGYPFRVLDPSGNIYYEYDGGKHFSGSPELELEIVHPLLIGEQRKGMVRNDHTSKRSFNPLVEYWFRKTVEDFTPLFFGAGEAPMAMLEIYYPLGPIDRVVSSRRAANLIVGTGILAVLFVSFLVMNRLYLRTKRLREREREFVAGVSHELRTPIAVIKSSSSNLARGLISDQEKVNTYGSIIEEQSDRLSRMVEGILTFAGLSNRKGQEEAAFAPRLLIEEIVSELGPTAEKNGVEIKIEMEKEIKDLPGTIISYPRAFRLILENLLTNAVYHGGKTSVYARLSAKPAENNNFLIIHVEDRGPGIPSEEAESVFGPFLRGKSAVENQRQGSGLGLHLIKEVLKEIGGTIELESPYKDRHGLPRTGCRFTVFIPFRDDKHG